MGSDLDHIADILRHANEARDYIRSSTKEQFRLNGKERDSANYKFIVIGEAANRLGTAFHKQHPTIPWSDIIGMRNIVAHQYGRVDPDIVWDAVKTKLPILIEYLTPLVKGTGNDDLGEPGNAGSESKPVDAKGPPSSRLKVDKGRQESRSRQKDLFRQRSRAAGNVRASVSQPHRRRTPEEAFEQATLDLAMSGIHIDPEQVTPLVAYRDRTMTYAEACEAMRKRHAGEDAAGEAS